MIEHPFGTIKRSWGYTYILVKSIKKVNAEMAIIFTMYNLRRAMSVFGVKGLIERLKQWKGGQKAQKQGFTEHIMSYKQYGHQLAA